MSPDPTIVQHAELGERLDKLPLAWRREGMPEVEKLFEELRELEQRRPWRYPGRIYTLGNCCFRFGRTGRQKISIASSA